MKHSTPNKQAKLASDRARRKKDRDEKKRQMEDNSNWHLETFKKNNQRDPLANIGNAFLRSIAEKAPKLLDVKEYEAAVKLMENLPHVRNHWDWEPKGKGRDTQFSSLAEHLFSKYKTPPFLWSAFFYTASTTAINTLVRAVVDIAAGGSLVKRIKDGKFNIPLTKKQCHSLLTSTSDVTFMYAVRREQVLTHGGSKQFLNAWMRTRPGYDVQSVEVETFWDTVIAWFAKHPMLDVKQVGPIVDWIAFRLGQDKTFSMKGRSPLAVMKAIQDWHVELGQTRVVSSKFTEYKASGFKPGRYPDADPQYQDWTVTEIRNNKQLADEGRALHHCVFSYGTSIERGDCSIWTLMQADVKRITLEVRGNVIVQRRGLYNRQPNNEEDRYILKWATQNNLTIGSRFGW